MGKGRLLLSLGTAGQCSSLGPQLNVQLQRMPSWETLDPGRAGPVGITLSPDLQIHKPARFSSLDAFR